MSSLTDLLLLANNNGSYCDERQGAPNVISQDSARDPIAAPLN